jgi:hypothetical protein
MLYILPNPFMIIEIRYRIWDHCSKDVKVLGKCTKGWDMEIENNLDICHGNSLNGGKYFKRQKSLAIKEEENDY